MKLFALLPFVLALGCHAQIPASPAPSVSLTWTAPTTCTAAQPCVYAISRAITTGTCPPTTGTAYTVAGTSTSQATSYVDMAPPQGSVCYIAQTQQGAMTSVPSNSVLVAVPSVPTAPNLNTPTTTAEVQAPNPTVAENEPLNLRVVRR